MKYIILITLTAATVSYSQFNELIFSKHFSDTSASLLWNSVLGLGDQNGDGYDDILIFECNRQVAGIYFGGNPMDTVPAIEFSIWMLEAKAVDINHNGFKDIAVVHYVPSTGGQVSIYYGGPLLDTIPDVIIERPPGSSQNFGVYIKVLEDFDGDGYPELIIADSYLPYSNKELWTLYFYKTYPELDTIPFAVIMGDSVTNRSIGGLQSGDINGDGLTDFTTRGYEGGYPYDRRSFYLGNPEWDLTPAITYKQEEHIFDLEKMYIIEDLNKDGRDDILAKDYDNTYPWWYGWAIWHGAFPIDTIPKVGVNTQNSTVANSRLIISPGDVNGDGFNDMMLGIGLGFAGPTASRLWLGSRIMKSDPTKSWGGSIYGYGRLLARIGDVDGDGVNDIVVGQAHDQCYNNVYGDFIYIIKGDTSVKIDTGTVGVYEEPGLPEQYILLDVYPNPFNPMTTIKYDIPKDGLVSLEIFDILGRKVATIVNEYQSAGSYSHLFNASSFSSGVYIYKLQSSDFVSSKKMILLK